MKLSVAIADQSAPPSAFVVWRGFEDSLPKAHELGYQGVELALKRAEDVDGDLLARWLATWNVQVSCISTGQVFATLGLYFTHPDPERRREVIEVFAGLVRLAKDFGGLVNVGRARGFVAQGQTRQQAEVLFVDTARRICDLAGPLGVDIIIEPVNRYEINFVNSVEQGAELLAKVERSNLGLMPDVFHMNIEDARIGATLAQYAHLIRYVHLADSNRLAPGQGHLDFDDVFDGLKNGGFDGWVAIEILPRPDPDTAALQAAEYVLPRVQAYNRAMGAEVSGLELRGRSRIELVSAGKGAT